MTFREGQERLAYALLRPINPSVIILLGVFTVVWGFWVGNPFWSAFSQSAVYSVMNFLPAPVWGAVAVIAGIVIAYGAFSKKPRALILGAQVGAIFWLVVSLMFFLGDWMVTAGITALLLAVYSAFIYLNLKVNSKHVDDKQDLFLK